MGEKSELLRLLECPNCLEYMYAPIYICSGGHSICKSCKKKVNNCPTCRSVFHQKLRNYSLEHIASIIDFPCPHERNGCTESMKYDELAKHGKSCGFRPDYCCILNDNECNYLGPRNAVMNHYKIQHVANCWMHESSMHAWTIQSPQYETHVVLCFGEMFYIHRGVVKNRNIYWTCQYIGNTEDAANFRYTITVENEDGGKYSYCDSCESELLSLQYIIASGRCFGMSMAVFERYADPEKKVWYTVTIEKKSDCIKLVE